MQVWNIWCARRAGNAWPKKNSQKSPSGHHRTTLSGYIFATMAHIDNRKNLLSSIISSTRPHNMVKFGRLAAEIVSLVWASQLIWTPFASWLRYCSDVAQRKPTKLCGVEHRAPPIFCRATIRLGIGPHSSLENEVMLRWYNFYGLPYEPPCTIGSMLRAA